MPSNAVIRIGMLRNLTVCSWVAWRLRGCQRGLTGCYRFWRTATRSAALAYWCEGFLHGLVSATHGAALKERLSAEPLADVIKDMLQLTRAGPGADSDAEANDVAYFELVEYVRVAAQLSYEELTEIRHSANAPGGNKTSGSE